MEALPHFPTAETKRLQALHELDLLDTPPETAFDELAALAANICGAPIALIALVDEHRQWFKSTVGTDLRESSRDVSICDYTIREREMLVIPDAREDERFARNPFVSGEPHIRFYAGAPLITTSGQAVGSLCVIDTEPRRLAPNHELALRLLSQHVMAQMEARLCNLRRQKAEDALRKSFLSLERCVETRTAALRLAEKEADAAHRQIFHIIERVSDGIAAMDREWRYTYVNLKTAELLGRTPSSLIGKCAWTEFPWAVGRPFHQLCLRAMAEQKPMYHEEYFPRWSRWLEGRLYPSEEGLSVFFRDITEQKANEEVLRKSGEHLSALAAHLQTAREQEAVRIARGLHDELGASLTGLKLDLSWLDRRLARDVAPEIAGPMRERSHMALDLVDETIHSVRKICRELRPAVLDQLGLAPAIEWQAGEFRARTGIHCAVTRPESVAVAPPQSIAVFRMFQEVLTNVARHAHANEVQVKLATGAGELMLEVADNGCGLPADALTRPDCFGLVGMRERALAAGGSVSFASESGKGTTVTIRVPLANGAT